jgi:hypothetical protein
MAPSSWPIPPVHCPSQVDIVPGAQEVEGIGLVGWHHSVCLKNGKVTIASKFFKALGSISMGS